MPAAAVTEGVIVAFNGTAVGATAPRDRRLTNDVEESVGSDFTLRLAAAAAAAAGMAAVVVPTGRPRGLLPLPGAAAESAEATAARIYWQL